MLVEGFAHVRVRRGFVPARHEALRSSGCQGWKALRKSAAGLCASQNWCWYVFDLVRRNVRHASAMPARLRKPVGGGKGGSALGRGRGGALR